MNKRNIILIVSISIFIGIVCLYTGLINEAALFGYSILKNWIYGNNLQISWNNDVTTVKKGEFAYRLLTNISIPDNITTIENGAFKGNKLTSVTIPANVTSIGEKAFTINKLTSITIGSNVSLGKNTFGFGFEDAYNKNSMDAGTYMRDDAKSIEWSTWHDNLRYEKNSSSRSITITGYNGNTGIVIIPETINGNPVNRIAEKAFKAKKLSSVTIPDGIINIGEEAFRDNYLSSVTIPASVAYIGENAFRENILTKLVISNDTNKIGILNIGAHAFRDNKLSSVDIPDSVSSIGYAVFYKNQLTSISIGKNVTNIGDYSFGANQLTRIIIPDKVRSIGVNAFTENQIVRVSIGENVSLGSDNSKSFGILGESTGFNTAYSNNNNRAGVYTRPNTRSTTWTRTPR